MNVEFNCAGMSFKASVILTPFVPAKTYGSPERCHPEESGEVDFNSIFCDDKDASFLLDSDLSDQINEAAYIAACEMSRSDWDDAAISRWESRHDV